MYSTPMHDSLHDSLQEHRSARRHAPEPRFPAEARLLYTPEQAAELLSVSRTRLYALLARGAIPSIKEGRARLIPAAALERYIHDRVAEQQPPHADSMPSRVYAVVN